MNSSHRWGLGLIAGALSPACAADLSAALAHVPPEVRGAIGAAVALVVTEGARALVARIRRWGGTTEKESQ